jgi:RNA polymerase sigma-70 factor (ECF subfamily)
MPSDEALFERLKGGDMAAFELLYRRYEGPLFGFVYKQLGDRGAAEDVFHEAFMAVLRERADLRLESFRAWIYQVARHLCLNRIRSRKRGDRAARAEAGEGPSHGPHAEELLAASEAPAALRRAVERLPAPLVDLYAMRASGLSYEDISNALGIPLGTVKSRMHDLVGRLREEIKPWTAR